MTTEDYLDYTSNQPMRDGEEICNFLDELNEKSAKKEVNHGNFIRKTYQSQDR